MLCAAARRSDPLLVAGKIRRAQSASAPRGRQSGVPSPWRVGRTVGRARKLRWWNSCADVVCEVVCEPERPCPACTPGVREKGSHRVSSTKMPPRPTWRRGKGRGSPSVDSLRGRDRVGPGSRRRRGRRCGGRCARGSGGCLPRTRCCARSRHRCHHRRGSRHCGRRRRHLGDERRRGHGSRAGGRRDGRKGSLQHSGGRRQSRGRQGGLQAARARRVRPEQVGAASSPAGKVG